MGTCFKIFSITSFYEVNKKIRTVISFIEISNHLWIRKRSCNPTHKDIGSQKKRSTENSCCYS